MSVSFAPSDASARAIAAPMPVPPPYLGGVAQLARNMAREAELKA
ncbi:MAG TPA: hypothetical protein VNT25_01405 [Allosphingosinicella sp.]|nr:hypothetical protein [Allosphingosinicella sp.]